MTAHLRELVPAAEQHVQEFTGLVVGDAHVPVAVVDRPGWVTANVGGFRVALEPLAEKVVQHRGNGGLVRAVGSRAAGVQVGIVLAYLAARVLGQFELFLPAGQGDGRLTLVAPNIVETERRLHANPDDFRLWVTLHEVTHRTQFTAVPWLRDHFTGLVREYVDASELDAGQVVQRLRSAVDAVRGGGRDSFLEAVQTPAQRAVITRVQALMSLLEGHGDYVMDGVGPTVVPTAAQIRAAFDKRRTAAGPVDRMVRRLLGLDLKLRQYAEGERFVRAVVDQVGMTGFNRVWAAPASLPTAAEIAAPQLWVDRVGAPAGEANPDGRA